MLRTCALNLAGHRAACPAGELWGFVRTFTPLNRSDDAGATNLLGANLAQPAPGWPLLAILLASLTAWGLQPVARQHGMVASCRARLRIGCLIAETTPRKMLGQ